MGRERETVNLLSGWGPCDGRIGENTRSGKAHDLTAQRRRTAVVLRT